MSNKVFCYQPYICREHLAFPGTSEKPGRHDAVSSVFTGPNFLQRSSGPASYQQLRKAHSAPYLEALTKTGRLSRLGGIRHALTSPYLQWYTAPHGNSFLAAKYAAGAVCAGVADVLSEKTNRVFCAVRPPGHHAGESYGEGFCILNNVAIGALEALQLGAKVAIIDFDRHHGNGTEEIVALADSSSLLFISSYQEYCKYAKDPMPTKTRSKLLRVPLPLDIAGVEFLNLYNKLVFPALMEHRPEIILISAGFDLHEADALKPRVCLKTSDYQRLSWHIASAANDLDVLAFVSP